MIFLLMLFMAAPLLTAEQLYLSDSLGIPGAPAVSVDEGEWILMLDQEGLKDRRILFKEGEPYKRWENSEALEQGELRIVEEYYFKDQLRSRTVLNRNAEIVEEKFYDSHGSLIIENSFVYDDSGRPFQLIRSEDGSDSVSWLMRYRDNGALSRLDSEDERVTWRAGDYEEDFLDTLYLQDKNRSYRYSYSGSLLTGKTLIVDDETVEESKFFYNEDKVLEKEIVLYPGKNGRTERTFDPLENLLIENRYEDSILVFSQVNTWNENRLIRRQERTGGVRRLWTWEYNSDESEPAVTKEYRNGSLIKETKLTETEIIITIFRNEEAVSVNRMPREES